MSSLLSFLGRRATVATPAGVDVDQTAEAADTTLTAIVGLTMMSIEDDASMEAQSVFLQQVWGDPSWLPVVFKEATRRSGPGEAEDALRLCFSAVSNSLPILQIMSFKQPTEFAGVVDRLSDAVHKALAQDAAVTAKVAAYAKVVARIAAEPDNHPVVLSSVFATLWHVAGELGEHHDTRLVPLICSHEGFLKAIGVVMSHGTAQAVYRKALPSTVKLLAAVIQSVAFAGKPLPFVKQWLEPMCRLLINRWVVMVCSAGHHTGVLLALVHVFWGVCD